ncbi:MAG: M1 family metallopeptidase [Gemmatimonadales bacterium]
MTTAHRALTLLALPGLIIIAPLHAQAVPVRDVPVVAPVATSVDTTLQQLQSLTPVRERSGEVHALILTRGTATITLQSGHVYALTPIGGRTVGVLFVGQGRYAASAPSPVERARLQQTTSGGEDGIDATFGSAAFLFADSTWEEISAQVTFGPDPVKPDAGTVDDMLDVEGGIDHTHFPTGMVGALLNGERSGFFFAYMNVDHGAPLGLRVDPDRVESVSLQRKASHTGVYREMENLALFAPPGTPSDLRKETTRTDAISNYTMDLDLPEAGGALAFNVRADLTIVPDGPVGPWIPLYLFDKLIGDSASVGGQATPIWKKKEHETMWVRLDRRVAPGDTDKVRIWYHGDLIDRFGDWFLVNPGSFWYPAPTDVRNYATFDVTFHTPAQYAILSVGDRTDSTVEPDHMLRTRWVIHTPIRNAAFNIGVFAESYLTADGVPPVTFLYSDRAIKYTVPAQYRSAAGNIEEGGVTSVIVTPDRKERKRVGADVQSALKFYTKMYGGPPVQAFYVGPIPYSEGIAFPGMIDLDMDTFVGGNGQPEGFDQFFRAHEVGHQWWGIAVDYASYRDQWLSEGLASFSGLWFMQTALKNNKAYFDFLERYRNDIKSVADAGPVALGYRASTQEHPAGYSVLIYEKGAWLAHMLRVLMLNFGSMNEDRFGQTMQDFYQSYHGGRASTADFQRVVEKHIGIPMDWFFKEYYEGTALPTYQTAWKAEAGADGKVTVHLRVAQSGVPDDFENYIPIAIDLGGNRVAHLRMHVKGPLTTMDVPGMPAAPKTVKFNDLSGVLAADFKNVGW